MDTGFGTFLLKKTPFQPNELDRLQQTNDLLGFKLLYAPGLPSDPTFKAFLETGSQKLINAYPLNISPPTDDRPFFFYQMRPGDYVPRILGGRSMQGSDPMHRAVAGILTLLLATSSVLVVGLLFIPLAWRVQKNVGVDTHNRIPLVYFALIGLGFMLVEIPLLQRLTIFLGKPIYAFSVVLFTLLVCAGIGSFLSQWLLRKSALAVHLMFALLTLLLLLITYGLPILLACAISWPEHLRIFLSVVCLAPLGVFLGLPLPLAVAHLGIQERSLIPLAWGINGGSSVLASVLAMVISINWGLTITLTIGLLCYLIAWMLWSTLTKLSTLNSKV